MVWREEKMLRGRRPAWTRAMRSLTGMQQPRSTADDETTAAAPPQLAAEKEDIPMRRYPVTRRRPPLDRDDRV